MPVLRTPTIKSGIRQLDKVAPGLARSLGLFLQSIDEWRATSSARRAIRRVTADGVVKPIGRLVHDYRPGSETVFILGSGASIAGVSNKAWAHIRQHDSFGFNFALIHPHRPNLYFNEGIRGEPSYQTWLAHIKRRMTDFAAVPHVINYEDWIHYCHVGDLRDFPPELLRRTYLVAPESYPALNENRIRRHLRVWARPDNDRSQQISTLQHHRGSLSLVVATAYCFGYKNIVLAGIDLNSRVYFWEVMDDLQGPFPPNALKGPAHSTVVDSPGETNYNLPMDLYLRLFREEVLDRAGIRLWNANPHSLLAKSIDFYDLEDPPHII